MADDAVRLLDNAGAPWNSFSSDDYWDHNYRKLQPEDREIIYRLSRFFGSAFADCRRKGTERGTASDGALGRDGYEGMIVATGFGRGR